MLSNIPITEARHELTSLPEKLFKSKSYFYIKTIVRVFYVCEIYKNNYLLFVIINKIEIKKSGTFNICSNPK